MSALLPLRPYQLEAVEAVEAAWTRGVRRPAVVLPTGAGKTVVFAHLAARWLERGREMSTGRVLVLAHRAELLDQAARRIKDVAPGLCVGTVAAGLDETDADVIVGSVQTLRLARRRSALADVALIVTDECFPAGTLVGDVPIEHLRPGDSVPSYDEETGEAVSGAVVALMSRRPSSLVRVTFDDGRAVHCTPDHPFLTVDGWTPAGRLSHGAEVVSFTHDATASGSDLHRVRRAGSHRPEGSDRLLPSQWADVLFRGVPGRLGSQGPVGEDVQDEPEVRLGSDVEAEPDAPTGDQAEDGRDPAADRAPAEPAWRERNADAGAAEVSCRVPGVAGRGRRSDADRRAAVALQAGHRASDDEGVCRGGRRVAPVPVSAGFGRQEGRVPSFVRVVGVQVLEPGRDGTYGGVCPDGLVYNIEVERTHTYLVNGGLVVHNCHHATAASYRAVYDAMPGAHMLGVTATMSRGDGQALGQVWDEIVYRRGIVEMIRDGHLADVRGIRVQVPDLDLSEVKVSRGDYAEGALGTALEASLAPEVVASAYLEHAADHKGLLFAPTVSSAQVLADALTGAGVGTEVVHGAMAGDERRAVLRRFETGATQVLSNCMVLTEGFDSPSASACVIARPTRSAPLYVQMAGRVLRPYPGKEHALVLDVVGATAMHSLASLATLAGAPVRDGQSLTEAETEEAEREDERARERLIHAGPVDAVEVDLFGASAFRWHQTRGGLWYIATGLRYWALIPGAEPGTYDVTWIAQRAPLDGKRGAFAQTGVSEISMAMAWAERGASDDDLGGTISGKGRHWHRKRPGEKQAAFASSLGIVITDDMRALDVSDAIDRIMASRAIDARMLPWLAAQGRDVPAPLAL